MGSKVGLVIAAAALACAATAGGAWWWVQQQTRMGSTGQQVAPAIDMSQASYVTLDKVVVMLRASGESQAPRGHNFYLAADLVLRTDKMHEKAVKAELPMLKGVAVQALSRMQVEQARSMGIEDWSALLQRELFAAYDDYPHLRLFDRVMVSRLIIE